MYVACQRALPGCRSFGRLIKLKRSKACEQCAKRRQACDSKEPCCSRCVTRSLACTYERSDETRRTKALLTASSRVFDDSNNASVRDESVGSKLMSILSTIENPIDVKTPERKFSLQDIESERTSMLQRVQIEKRTRFSLWDSYNAVRKHYSTQIVCFSDPFGRPVLKRQYFSDLIGLGLDIVYSNFPAFHPPTMSAHPFYYGNTLLENLIETALTCTDGLTTLGHHSMAQNHLLSSYLARRTYATIRKRAFQTMTHPEQLRIAIAISMQMGLLMVHGDRRNALCERYVSYAISLITEIPITFPFSALDTEACIRTRWALFCCATTGMVGNREIDIPSLTENVPLPLPDNEFFQGCSMWGPAMPTLPSSEAVFEEFWPRLSPFAITCVLFWLQQRVITCKRNGFDLTHLHTTLKWWHERIWRLHSPLHLPSNDAAVTHWSHIRLLSCYTQMFLYLPTTMSEFLDVTWIDRDFPAFESSLKLLGMAANEFELLMERLDVDSVGQFPMWQFPIISKLTLLLTILLKHVRSTSDEVLDDLVQKAKVFVIGLRYSSFTDKALLPIADMLSRMISDIECNVEADAITTQLQNWLISTFPLMNSGGSTMPPEYVEIVFPKNHLSYVDVISGGHYELTQGDLDHDVLQLCREPLQS